MAMVFQLEKDIIAFPDPRLGEPDGVFAVGADISPCRMRLAYVYGILPWYDYRRREPVWYCPMQRFVIFPEEVHVSHSLRSLINKGKYRVTFNEAFEDVVRGCGTGGYAEENRHDLDGAWLGEEMVRTVLELHSTGDAISVEVWNGHGDLAGGLYGIVPGNIFCGESMFSREPSASKLALVALARRIQEGELCGKRFTLIDCQFETPHLRSMGARFIGYEEYLLHNGITLPPVKGV